jgi:uncharacterized protein
MTEQSSTKTVKCPICRKDVSVGDPNMPFCSDRCRLLDLGNWAAERYVISTPTSRSDFEDERSENE